MRGERRGEPLDVRNAGARLTEILARLIERPVGPAFSFGDYQVARSATREEELEVFEFRYRSFSEAGFLDPAAFSCGLLADQFDGVATLITVRDPLGRLVGTTRFVPSSILGFHTETLFDFDLPSVGHGNMAEFGRLAISIDHRGGHRIVMLAMLKAVFDCMIETGTVHVLAFLPPKLADSFSRLGCKPLVLRTRSPGRLVVKSRAAMRPYFDSQCPIPVLYDLEQMLVAVGVRRRETADDFRLPEL